MSTTLTFQTELVTIMDVLTKAAVTEISKLLEDGYAELRLAISQCHRENEELKRQLAIQNGANRRTPESSASCDVITGGCVVHIHRDKRRNSVAEGVHGELIADRCGDTESSTLDNRWLLNKKCVHKGEERGESKCIKVERLEDDLKSCAPPQGHGISEKRALDSEGAVRASVEELQTEQAVGTEFSGHHNSRHDDWDDGRLGSVLKAEPAHENRGILDTRSELTAGSLNCQGQEYNFYEGPSEVNTVLTERTIETETVDPIHCYLRDPNSDSYLAQSERRLIPATAKDSGKNVLSMGSLGRTDSALFEMGADVCFIWNKEMPSGPRSSVRLGKPPNENSVLERHKQQLPSATQEVADSGHPSCSYSVGCTEENHFIHLELEDGQNQSHFELNSGSIDDSTATWGKSWTSSSSQSMQCREKMQTICTLCGKKLSRPQTLEAHLRIHTGERPYSCKYCGKKFNQLGNLKTHQRTHTGQKPFKCIHCGKQFSDQGYLKRHQHVHTGERPFKCAECGKSFSFSNNLIRHRSVHTVKII